MGYVRTIASIMKELGRLGRHREAFNYDTLAGPESKELFDLLQGVTKVPKKEFGRFNSLDFSNIIKPAAGTYNPQYGEIMLRHAPYEANRIKTFMHELTHAKQYRPNPEKLDDARRFVATADFAAYPDKPTERLAQITAAKTFKDPSLFSKVYEAEYDNPYILEAVLDKLKSANKAELQGAFYRAKQNVLPYSGKGWLYGGAGIGMARTGEE